MSLGDDLGFPPEVFSYQPEDSFVLPRCRLGLEFEFERVGHALPKDQGWTAYWGAKKDGSLHDNGIEYTFNLPLFGKDVVLATHSLLAWAREKGHRTSIRTGLHVHVDVRDMNLVQLRMLCTLYALYERAVYNFVGNNREENVFCYPWFAAQGAVDIVKWIVNAANPPTLREASKALAQEKYAGLNLDSLARFGSVEFRHAICTLDYHWVLNWISIVQRFKEAAIRITDDTKALIESVAMDPITVAKNVFRDQFPLLAYAEMAQHTIETGIPTALDLVVHRSGWNAISVGENAGFKAFAEGYKPAKRKPKTAEEELDQILRVPRVRPARVRAMPEPDVQEFRVEGDVMTAVLPAEPPPRTLQWATIGTTRGADVATEGPDMEWLRAFQQIQERGTR